MKGLRLCCRLLWPRSHYDPISDGCLFHRDINGLRGRQGAVKLLVSQDKKPGKSQQPGQREARLAAALRENLKKRKAQARERAAGAPRKDETASR